MGTLREPEVEERARLDAFSRQRYPLDEAIVRDQVDQARQLLADGADPNRRWKGGDRFPLQEAVDRFDGWPITNRTELVRLLLSHGADPNAKWCPSGSRSPSYGMQRCTSDTGFTPLIAATNLDNREIVELLLDAGADPRHETWMNLSALDYARDDVVFELISRAMFPDLKTRDRNSLAWLERHRDQLPEPFRKETPLSSALYRGFYVGDDALQRNSVRLLLSIGADPNERFAEEQTPLSRALESPDLRVVHALLEHGADPNGRWCKTDRTKCDPACTIQNGITPLMYAAELGSRPAVELLLRFKADKSLRDWAGRAAIHYATTRETWELTRSTK